MPSFKILTLAAVAVILGGCAGFSTPEERADAQQRADDLIRVAAEWRSDAVAERAAGNDADANKLETAARAADAAAGLSQSIADEDPAGAMNAIMEGVGETVPAPWGKIMAGAGGLALAEWMRRQQQRAKVAGTLVATIEDTGGPDPELAAKLKDRTTPNQKATIEKMKQRAKIRAAGVS